MKTLIGTRLVKLREIKGLTQKTLAKSAKMRQSQLVRIERSPDGPRQNKTIENLAIALGVDFKVLTGELPIPQELVNTTSEKIITDIEGQATINVKVSYDIRNWYDLIRFYYGVSMSDLVRVAPLLLVLVAEGGKKWQEQENDSAKKLLDQIKAKTAHLPTSFDINKQCSSIEGNLPAVSAECDLTTEDTFVAYLRLLAEKVEINVPPESIKFHQSDFVSYDILKNKPEWSCLSLKIKEEISKGHKRFPQVIMEMGEQVLKIFGIIYTIINEKTDLDPRPLFDAILSIELTKEKIIEMVGGYYSQEYFSKSDGKFFCKGDDQESFQIREIWNIDPDDFNSDELGNYLNFSKSSFLRTFHKLIPLLTTPDVVDQIKVLIDDLDKEIIRVVAEELVKNLEVIQSFTGYLAIFDFFQDGYEIDDLDEEIIRVTAEELVKNLEVNQAKIKKMGTVEFAHAITEIYTTSEDRMSAGAFIANQEFEN